MDGGKSKVILLVEDETLIAMSEAMILEKYNYKVITVNTGKKAVETVNNTKNIDLILMDINLGEGMDGTIAAMTILEKHNIPLIFLSSHAEREVVEKTEGITSYGYIVKNSGETVLIASIKMAFRLFESQIKEKESDAFRKRVFESSIMPIVVMDGLTFEFIECNPAAVAIYGFQFREEVLGKTPLDVSAPNQYDGTASSIKVRYYIDKAKAEGQAVFKWLHRRSNGELWDGEVHLMCFYSKGQLFLQFTLQDITERKKAEEALRESEEKFRILFDENPLPSILSEVPSGKIAFVNKRMVAIMRMSPEAIIGKTANDLALLENPDDQDKLTGLITSKGYVDDIEIAKTLPDGAQGADLVFMRLVTINKKLYCLTIIHDISGQKQTAEALRKSEERYRRLIETTDTGYVIIDNKGAVLDANQEYVRLSGNDKLEDILGRNVVEWTAEEVKETNAMAVAACIKNGFIRNFEITYVDKKGRQTPVEINATTIETEGRQIILSICRDITERKRAERAVRESEERLSRFMDSASDSFYLLDSKLNFIEINKRGLEIVGKKKEDVIGKNIADIVPDVKTSGRYEKHLEVIKTGKPYEIDHFVPHPVFGDLHFVLKAFKVGDGEGVIAHEITEHVKAEQKLRESEERFSKAFKTSPYAYVIANMEDGAIIEVNDAFTVISGFTREEALVSSTLNLKLWVHEEDRERMVAVLRKTGAVTRMETNLRAKNGNIITVLFSAHAIQINKKPCIISIIEDINERKKMEEELKASEERFRQLSSLATEGIMIQKNGIILDANQAFIKLSGCSSPQELIGKKGVEVMPFTPESRKKIIDRLRSLSNDAYDVELIAPDGSLLKCEVHSQTIPYKGEEARIVFMRAVTGRRKAENKIKRLEQKRGTLKATPRRIKKNKK